MKYKNIIDHIFKLVISVLIAVEVSIPPNPYKEELILVLVMYLCFKHNIPDKIIETISKLTTLTK